jgi:hypothetical protein
MTDQDDAGAQLGQFALQPLDAGQVKVIGRLVEQQRDDLPQVDCYRAGVLAWRHAHPDQQPKYAAQKAVDVMLAARVSLRVDDA